MFRKLTLTLTTLVLGFSIFIGTTTSASAQDLDKGFRAYGSGDYATALKEWRPLAERGLANAQWLRRFYADNDAC